MDIKHTIQISSPGSPRSKCGQASVEFCIGLIAILAVVGGLVQLGQLCLTRTELRVDATRQAAELSLLSSAQTGHFNPSYLAAVTEGADEQVYSEDDGAIGASGQSVLNELGPYLRVGDVRNFVPGSDFGNLSSGSEMLEHMGLVKGAAYEYDIPVLPVVRSLIYNTDSFDLDSEVWTTRLGDFY